MVSFIDLFYLTQQACYKKHYKPQYSKKIPELDLKDTMKTYFLLS